MKALKVGKSHFHEDSVEQTFEQMDFFDNAHLTKSSVFTRKLICLYSHAFDPINKLPFKKKKKKKTTHFGKGKVKKVEMKLVGRCCTYKYYPMHIYLQKCHLVYGINAHQMCDCVCTIKVGKSST